MGFFHDFSLDFDLFDEFLHKFPHMHVRKKEKLPPVHHMQRVPKHLRDAVPLVSYRAMTGFRTTRRHHTAPRSCPWT